MSARPDSGVRSGAGRVVDWTPGRGTGLALTTASVVLTVLATAGYVMLWASTEGVADGTVTVGFDNLVPLVGLVLAIAVSAVVHEGLHGLALLTLGHRPRFGATLVGGVLPALYCTSTAVLSRRAFTYVALLPGVVLALAPALWIVARLPYAGWTVLPAAAMFGGAVGDVAMTARAWRTPAGTRVEDRKDGLRLHLPS